MTTRTFLIAVAGVASALTAGNAAAGSFYLGAELSRERLTFNPHYYEPDGSPDGAFTNRASGTGAGIFAGHRWSISPAFSVAIEARLAANDARWKLRLDEPASFRYSIPLTAALSVQPAFQLSDRVELYAEAGIAAGRIRERKSAPATSAYDESQWRGGTVVGAGIKVVFGQSWSARVGYRQTRYRELSFTSRAPDGSLIERLRDRPEQKSWHLGVARTF